MNQLAQAFSKLAKDSELGKMAHKAVDKYKQDIKQRNRTAWKRKQAKMSDLDAYERRIMQTHKHGLDNFSPCSGIAYRPSTPAKSSTWSPRCSACRPGR